MLGDWIILALRVTYLLEGVRSVAIRHGWAQCLMEMWGAGSYLAPERQTICFPDMMHLYIYSQISTSFRSQCSLLRNLSIHTRYIPARRASPQRYIQE